MRSTRIIVLKQHTQQPQIGPDTVVTDTDEIKGWIKSKKIFQHLFHYSEASGFTYDLPTLIKPLGFALLLRIFTYGKCMIMDQGGKCQPITYRYFLRLLIDWVRDFFQQKSLLQKAQQEVAQLTVLNQHPYKGRLCLLHRPVYLRVDLVFGLQSGGSVGHIAGVLNHLDQFSGKPIFITTDYIPTVRNELERYQIGPDQRFKEFSELRPLAFNDTFYGQTLNYLQKIDISFIYQRYSVNNFAGLKLARTRRVPFILEYNGSEIWVRRHWGNRLSHEALAEKIELANLHGAQVVVVVSQVLKEELVARGIDAAKILVNPNGVDPERYSPQIDGNAVRERHQLAHKVVIGFIGTFGPWHGAELLADAYGRLLQQRPAYRESTRLLLIGDGVKLAEVKANLAKHEATGCAILTGLVPQAQGPRYLAACDILVSPHVPNPDGTPFFGSPTKLFEYMAMGKGIVASDLAQIGEILHHDQTAWLVKPGDAEGLAVGIWQLIEDVERRQRLGGAAREAVVAHYTWRAHTQRIIEALQQRMMATADAPVTLDTR